VAAILELEGNIDDNVNEGFPVSSLEKYRFVQKAPGSVHLRRDAERAQFEAGVVLVVIRARGTTRL
jgi:hypothetical protein